MDARYYSYTPFTLGARVPGAESHATIHQLGGLFGLDAAEIAASLSPANQASGARALSQFSASLTHIEPPSGISASLKS